MPLSLVLAPRRSAAQRMESDALRSVVQCGQCVCDDTLLQALHECVIAEMGQMWAGILIWYRSVTNTNVSV